MKCDYIVITIKGEVWSDMDWIDSVDRIYFVLTSVS